MDAAVNQALKSLDGRLRELEGSENRRPVRVAAGGGGSSELRIEPVTELPAIPTLRPQFVDLENDTVYWAAPGDTNWHPLGGKFGMTDGSPGSSYTP